MMTTDGEPAKQRRRPFDATLRPRAVEARMPPIFERLCRERLDAIAAAGRAELLGDYFEPVSLRSLAHVVGVAEAVDDPTLARWFSGLAAGVSNYEDDPAKSARCAAVSREIDEAIVPLFEARHLAPDDGLLSHLVGATEGPLEDRIAFAMPSLKLVFLGGLQEPAHGGTTIAACLLAHPDQLAAVRADPGLVPAAVEEGLRWTAPIGNLSNAKTPMLIQHGSEDRRVPLSNAMELYRGLQARQVPVELFIYPGMAHPITKPRENYAVMQQNLTWFCHYLLGRELKLEAWNETE
jgi:cytochrome P450